MAKLGLGTTLGIDDGSSGFNIIGEITDINTGMSADIVDATHQGSTNRWAEKLKGVKDGGQITFTTIADVDFAGDTTNFYSELVDELKSDTATDYRITGSNSETLDITAFLVGLSQSYPTRDKVETSVTLEITGEPTWG